MVMFSVGMVTSFLLLFSELDLDQYSLRSMALKWGMHGNHNLHDITMQSAWTGMGLVARPSLHLDLPPSKVRPLAPKIHFLKPLGAGLAAKSEDLCGFWGWICRTSLFST